MTSQSLRLSTLSARATAAGASGPWTLTWTNETRKPKPEPVSCPRKSWHPSVPGLATSPTCSAGSGTGSDALRAEQALGLERAQQPGALGGHVPQQRGDVDLDEDEADLALGPVEVERAAQHHDHPLGELDALLGQPVAQRGPRAAPALHVERGLATAGPRPGAAVVVGVDQVQVEMARAVVRDVLDLPAHPQGPVPGEGPAERALDLLVEAADGEDAAPPARLGAVWAAGYGAGGLGAGGFGAGGFGAAGLGLAIRLGGLLRGGERWSLGIEELAGATGHRRHPTDVLCRHPRTRSGGRLGPTVSRPGGRGTGRSAGPCRGRSGLRRAGCWLTASRGDPQDSATERKPPMAGPPGPHR